jgi:hypothetical protein
MSSLHTTPSRLFSTLLPDWLHRIEGQLAERLHGAHVVESADEAYLAEAVDVYDLERRMHEVDERGAGMGAWPNDAPSFH